jgi:DNA-binding MarR family transcriptional regulator
MGERSPARNDEDIVEFTARASPADIERLGVLIDQLRFGYGKARGHLEDIRAPLNVNPTSVSVARLLLLQRRDRGRTFADCDFGEAVWDVMLHLYVAHHEQRQVGAFALASVIDVPQSTALRWIATMEERGQLVREPDRRDRRRSFVALTPPFRERIAAHLERVRDEMMAMFSGRHDWNITTQASIGIGSCCER